MSGNENENENEIVIGLIIFIIIYIMLHCYSNNNKCKQINNINNGNDINRIRYMPQYKHRQQQKVKEMQNRGITNPSNTSNPEKIRQRYEMLHNNTSSINDNRLANALVGVESKKGFGNAVTGPAHITNSETCYENMVENYLPPDSVNNGWDDIQPINNQMKVDSSFGGNNTGTTDGNSQYNNVPNQDIYSLDGQDLGTTGYSQGTNVLSTQNAYNLNAKTLSDAGNYQYNNVPNQDIYSLDGHDLGTTGYSQGTNVLSTQNAYNLNAKTLRDAGSSQYNNNTSAYTETTNGLDVINKDFNPVKTSTYNQQSIAGNSSGWDGIVNAGGLSEFNDKINTNNMNFMPGNQYSDAFEGFQAGFNSIVDGGSRREGFAADEPESEEKFSYANKYSYPRGKTNPRLSTC